MQTKKQQKNTAIAGRSANRPGNLPKLPERPGDLRAAHCAPRNDSILLGACTPGQRHDGPGQFFGSQQRLSMGIPGGPNLHQQGPGA